MRPDERLALHFDVRGSIVWAKSVTDLVNHTSITNVIMPADNERNAWDQTPGKPADCTDTGHHLPTSKDAGNLNKGHSVLGWVEVDGFSKETPGRT